MKIRNGFVSNSSSSSFIVIGSSGRKELPSWRDQLEVTLPQGGNTEFGWEFDRWQDVDSRINFCYIQALSTNRDDWLNMLRKVIEENTSVRKIQYKYSYTWNDNDGVWSYIDHQSCATEGRNIEMFENEEELAAFLFDCGSYIQGGNDNV